MAIDSDHYSVKELISLFVIPALDDLHEGAVARDKQYAAAFEKQGERLTKLEAWRDKGIGAVAILTGIVIPVAVPVLITLLTSGIATAAAMLLLNYWP